MDTMTPDSEAQLSVTIPAELHRHLKVATVLDRTTIRAAVVEAIERWLQNRG